MNVDRFALIALLAASLIVTAAVVLLPSPPWAAVAEQQQSRISKHDMEDGTWCYVYHDVNNTISCVRP
jgi:hypothetical protein